jgi:hypothetical protein
VLDGNRVWWRAQLNKVTITRIAPFAGSAAGAIPTFDAVADAF